MIKVLGFLGLLSIFGYHCVKRDLSFVPSDAPSCGTTYNLSDLYFNEDDTLYFNVKFHYILTDSTQKADSSDMAEFFTINNSFYKPARVQFVNNGYCETIDAEESENMPNFKKFVVKHGEEGSINVFVYANRQPYYTGDSENVVGIAAGIGSTFFAIRKNFVRTLTATHELGHNLGLLHLTTPDETNGLNDFTGDLVCDTRSINDLSSKVNYMCEFIGNDNFTEKEKEILTKNLMSWVHLHCREIITENQMARIKWMIENSSDLRKCIKEIKHE